MSSAVTCWLSGRMPEFYAGPGRSARRNRMRRSGMHPDRWQRIEAIYHDASALAGDERAAYLHETCRDDPALLAEVESLLDEDGARSFLDTPAANVGRADAQPAGAGQRLGNYLLVDRLGTGS